MGADPSLIGAATWLDTEATLAAGGVQLISMKDNLVDRVWTEEDGREPFVVQLLPHCITYIILLC